MSSFPRQIFKTVNKNEYFDPHTRVLYDIISRKQYDFFNGPHYKTLHFVNRIDSREIYRLDTMNNLSGAQKIIEEKMKCHIYEAENKIFFSFLKEIYDSIKDVEEAKKLSEYVFCRSISDFHKVFPKNFDYVYNYAKMDNLPKIIPINDFNENAFLFVNNIVGYFHVDRDISYVKEYDDSGYNLNMICDERIGISIDLSASSFEKISQYENSLNKFNIVGLI